MTDSAHDSVSALALQVFELSLVVSRLGRALAHVTTDAASAAKWREALAFAALQEKVIAREMALAQRARLVELDAPEMILAAKDADIALLDRTIVAIKDAVAAGEDHPCTLWHADGTVAALEDLLTSFARSPWPILHCDEDLRHRLLAR